MAIGPTGLEMAVRQAIKAIVMHRLSVSNVHDPAERRWRLSLEGFGVHSDTFITQHEVDTAPNVQWLFQRKAEDVARGFCDLLAREVASAAAARTAPAPRKTWRERIRAWWADVRFPGDGGRWV
jgi:hypothetical protein